MLPNFMNANYPIVKRRKIISNNVVYRHKQFNFGAWVMRQKIGNI